MRRVYNAAAKFQGKCLNSFVYCGPAKDKYLASAPLRPVRTIPSWLMLTSTALTSRESLRPLTPIESNRYMDDTLESVDSSDAAICLYRDLAEIMKRFT